MSLSRERINRLLDAFTSETATAEEEQELFHWLETASDDTPVEEHIKHLIEEYAGEERTSANWDYLYRSIMARINRSRKPSPPIALRRKLTAAAAAILLILAAGSAYLLSNRKTPPDKASLLSAHLYSNDIKPGKTTAFLQAGNVKVALNKTDTSFALGGNTVYLKGGHVKIANIKPTTYTLITPRGGDYCLNLSDGSTVWLNADSRLVYPSVFSGEAREVILEGEAYFKIHTDPSHPFIVHTARQQVKVLGTEFNVHAYVDEPNTITTLVSGSVKVTNTSDSLTLMPGQQAQSDQGGQLVRVPDADVEQAVAWKNGYFRFNKADIHTIMQQLSRWYNVKVQYSDNLNTRYFGAVMSRNNNIWQILRMMEATGDVHFKIKGNEVTVEP